MRAGMHFIWGLVAGLPALLPTGVMAVDSTYNPVTQKRLENPEPHNWLMYRGNYAGWGYSPLKSVNAKNVGSLQPVWTISTGVLEGPR